MQITRLINTFKNQAICLVSMQQNMLHMDMNVFFPLGYNMHTGMHSLSAQ